MNTLCKSIFSLTMCAMFSFAARAGVVGSVEMKSAYLGDTPIVAEISGLLPNACAEITSAWYEPGLPVKLNPDINLHLTVDSYGEICEGTMIPFREEIFIGDLASGKYLVRVYENDLLTYTTEIVVPNDILPFELDILDGSSVMDDYASKQ